MCRLSSAVATHTRPTRATHARASSRDRATPHALRRSLKIAVIFAGDCAAYSCLVRKLRRVGHVVTAIDSKIGGHNHDVGREAVAAHLVRLIEAGHFDAVFLAPPCRSFSIRLPVKLRSKALPRGVDPPIPGWESYLDKSNGLVDFTTAALRACLTSHTPFAVENPASRADGSPAYWPEFADHASLWDVKEIADALADAGATQYTFAQCHPLIGGKAQKWTTIAASGRLAAALAVLSTCLCPHGLKAHDTRLEGRDAAGATRSALAAAYPPGLDHILFTGLDSLAEDAADPSPPTTDAPTRPPTSGGRVTDGHALGPVSAAACEAARQLAPTFSSLRNTEPAATADLKREPYPGNLFAAMDSGRKPSASKALRRKSLPTPVAPPDHLSPDEVYGDHPSLRDFTPTPWSPDPEAAQPKGRIHISHLHLPGVYEAEIASWFDLADEAADSLRQGIRPPPVPTRVIGQQSLRPWARGIVWDCRDPDDCVPLTRSSASDSDAEYDAAFPGRKLDRAACRRVAEELRWHDTDIIEQICGGGIEVRSDCELDTVLTFHHDSLVAEIEMAAADVAAGIEEGWVKPPSRHLPFVPCRMQPRGVVMQARSKVVDGVLVEYLKPRITTDNSFGGIDSVNAGVADSDRAVILPSGQTFGRAWAICQTAYDDHPTANAKGYVVDAEKAYRFCPVQRADLWLQCFLWWDTDGRTGAAVDTRMGFGGAFAPNRYERTSLFAAAYAQRLQDEFDASQPPPASVRRWSADRAALIAQGLLDGGPEHAAARFIQAFIDDQSGVAGDDIVVPPPSVAHLHVDTAHMRAAGCNPPPPNSRVFIHAKLTMLALHTLGLVAAPEKVFVGSPLPVLGLSFNGESLRIECPKGKRDAISAVCAKELERVERDGTVDRDAAGRLVGRICNISQVAPELRPLLRGGYAVVEAPTGGKRSGRPTAAVSLAAGSLTHTGWTSLLRETPTILQSNLGAAMAPSLRAPGRHIAGTLTITADASGVDGVGGYAFLAGRPDTVFILSAVWPSDVQDALTAAASPTQARLRDVGRGDPFLPMPAAELFAQIEIARQVQRIDRVTRVAGVCDCEPAVNVINSIYSPNTFLNSLLEGISPPATQWVAAHVRREFNKDADTLSHPDLAHTIRAAARSAGIEVVDIHPNFDRLRDAIVAGTAAMCAGRGRRKRRRSSTRTTPTPPP